MGADKWLTISNYKRCEGNVRQCADRLHAAGYTLVATLPAENSVFIEDLPIDQKTAFFFGTELTGLSDEAKAVCDRAVKIPMYGFTESFNISNSVAISSPTSSNASTAPTWSGTSARTSRPRYTSTGSVSRPAPPMN